MKIIVCPHCGMEIDLNAPAHADKSSLYRTMDSSIEHFCPSFRAFHALWRVNINTMADLHAYIQKNGAESLVRIYGIGAQTSKVILSFYEDFMKKHAEYLEGLKASQD